MSGARRIFLVSASALLLELSWIRYLGSEIRIFAYFHNLLLLVCFLGLGYGCARADRPARLGRTFALSLLLVLLLVPDESLGPFAVRKLTSYLGSDPTYHTWGARVAGEGLRGVARFGAGLVMLSGIVVALVALLAPVGQTLGRLLRDAPHAVRAYSSDIAGSLCGVAAFTALSFLSLPPGVWLAVALGVLLVFLPRRPRVLAGAALAILAVALLSSQRRRGEDSVVWSPYQRLSSIPQVREDSAGRPVETGVIITTNHADYMRVGNYAPEFVTAHPEFFAEPALRPYDNYNLPYRFHPDPQDVLIVGAGAGNDVAGALRNGAQHIDAVEIDPEIVRYGAARHPERPYDARFAGRVRLHVDDARSFFRKTDRRYDVIVFGTLDSHTLSSSLCNVRLDNFVYTVESLREAKRLLKPQGIVVLLFAANEPFLGVRIRQELEEVFGYPPFCLTQRSKIVYWVEYFVSGSRETIAGRLAADPTLAAVWADKKKEWPGHARVASDDWPYLYLREPAIPRIHVATFLLLGALAYALLFRDVGPGRLLDRRGLGFFFLGAGFMLLEVQGVTRAALLFGATWLNNSIVIAGILVSILAANAAVVRWRPARPGPALVGVLVLLALAWLFPAASLNALPLVPRLGAAVLLLCSPVALAGVAFAVLFERAPDRHLAFAANLLGAMAGGVAESLSFVLGLRALTLVAMVFYALAWAACAWPVAAGAGRGADGADAGAGRGADGADGAAAGRAGGVGEVRA